MTPTDDIEESGRTATPPLDDPATMTIPTLFPADVRARNALACHGDVIKYGDTLVPGSLALLTLNLRRPRSRGLDRQPPVR